MLNDDEDECTERQCQAIDKCSQVGRPEMRHVAGGQREPDTGDEQQATRTEGHRADLLAEAAEQRTLFIEMDTHGVLAHLAPPDSARNFSIFFDWSFMSLIACSAAAMSASI